MKILILEDSAWYSEHLQQNLEDIGHESVWARNSEEARKYLKDTSIQLGIFDIRLTGEQDGAGIIMAKSFMDERKIPVILATDFSQNAEFYEMAKQAGISTTKYFKNKKDIEDLNRLSDLLDEAIEEHRSTHQPTQIDPTLLAQRKIGLLNSKGGSMTYEFVSKDEIMYLHSAGDSTNVYIKGRDNKLVITRHLKSIGGQINMLFPNIVRIGNKHFINLEQISKLEGLAITFSDGKTTLLIKGDVQDLRNEGVLLSTR